MCSLCRLLSWGELIPVISWIALGGKCYVCKRPISPLYIFIELTTTVVLTALFISFFGYPGLFGSVTIPLEHLPHFLLAASFFSFLIMNTRTALRAMIVIDQLTLLPIPLFLAGAYVGIAPVNLYYSLIGCALGAGLLFLVKIVFSFFSRTQGLGLGDVFFVGLIGSYLGPIGVWFSIMLGSFSGLLIGGIYLLLARKGRRTRIPFVPFLALGALLAFFFESELVGLFF